MREQHEPSIIGSSIDGVQKMPEMGKFIIGERLFRARTRRLYISRRLVPVWYMIQEQGKLWYFESGCPAAVSSLGNGSAGTRIPRSTTYKFKIVDVISFSQVVCEYATCVIDKAYKRGPSICLA